MLARLHSVCASVGRAFNRERRVGLAQVFRGLFFFFDSIRATRSEFACAMESAVGVKASQKAEPLLLWTAEVHASSGFDTRAARENARAPSSTRVRLTRCVMTTPEAALVISWRCGLAVAHQPECSKNIWITRPPGEHSCPRVPTCTWHLCATRGRLWDLLTSSGDQSVRGCLAA